MDAKRTIAKKCGEITQLWMCGQKIKTLAHAKGIYSWHNDKFTSILGKTHRDSLIRKIIEINNPHNCTAIINKPAKLIMPIKNDKCAFLDFEVLSDVIMDNSFSKQTIFMIGIGHDLNGEFIYKQFTCVDTSQAEELRICTEFTDYISSAGLHDHHFIHWSRAEDWQWRKAKDRFSHEKKLKLFDLCEFVKANQIVVRGAYDFSLKNFAKAMHAHKLISSSWCDNGPTNGLDAIFTLHNSIRNGTFDLATIDVIKYYNYIDIKVLHELWGSFALPHSPLA
jgi:hypothetical protein